MSQSSAYAAQTAEATLLQYCYIGKTDLCGMPDMQHAVLRVRRWALVHRGRGVLARMSEQGLGPVRSERREPWLPYVHASLARMAGCLTGETTHCTVHVLRFCRTNTQFRSGSPRGHKELK